MSAHKLYMIDDKETKHEWFLKIITAARASLPTGVSLVAGFGDDAATSRNNATSPECLAKALQDPEGIYLVDLVLLRDGERSDRDPAGIIDLFDKAASASNENRAVKAFRAAAAKEGSVEGKHQAALLVLHYCKIAGKKAVLVSTDAQGADVNDVVDNKLAIRPKMGFPYKTGYTNTESTTLTSAWVAELKGLLQDELECLASESKVWFSKNVGTGWTSLEAHGLPHETNWTAVSLADHKRCVRSLLPWLPEGCPWWEDADRTGALHEVLKATVGAHAEWVSESGKYSLPLGGAYLFFLMVVARTWSERVAGFIVPDWRLFCEADNPSLPKPFCPPQSQIDAERTVRALYDLFGAILPLHQGQQEQSSSACAATQIEFPTPHQSYFRVKLSWKPNDRQNCAKEVARLVNAGFASRTLGLGAGTTVGSILSFTTASQVRREGFGPVGCVALDDQGWLKVGR